MQYKPGDASFTHFGAVDPLGHVPSSFFCSITRTCGRQQNRRKDEQQWVFPEIMKVTQDHTQTFEHFHVGTIFCQHHKHRRTPASNDGQRGKLTTLVTTQLRRITLMFSERVSDRFPAV